MRKFLSCHAHERMGFILVSLISFMCLSMKYWMPTKPGVEVDLATIKQWEEETALFIQPGKPDTFLPFPFDPNKIALPDWTQLGIPKPIAKRIENYRLKGGKFRVAEDLKKIYGMRESDYLRLEPYIQIEDKANKPTQSLAPDFKRAEVTPFPIEPNEIDLEGLIRAGLSRKVATTWIKYREAIGGFRDRSQLSTIYGIQEDWLAEWGPMIKFDDAKSITSTPAQKVLQINTASEQEWQHLRGIGPVLSKRIVKFREKLGGFSSTEQVGETFGLPDSTFQAIQPLLSVEDSVALRQIFLNRCTKEELAAHPYLSWKQAETILSYRRHHGPFQRVEALADTKVVSHEEIQQIAPYLSLDDASAN